MARFNYGLFNCFRLIYIVSKNGQCSLPMLEWYNMFAMAVLVVVGLIVAIRKLTVWQSMTALLCVACFIPTLSASYKGLQLMIPLAMMLNTQTKNNWRVVVISILFGLLLIPKNYLIFGADIGISSIIDPLILTALCGFTLWLPPANVTPAKSTSAPKTI